MIGQAWDRDSLQFTFLSARRPPPRRPSSVRTGPGFRSRGRRPPAGGLRRPAPPGPLRLAPLENGHTARPHRSGPIARSRHRQTHISLCHPRWLQARGTERFLSSPRFPAGADPTGTGVVRDVRAAGSDLVPPRSWGPAGDSHRCRSRGPAAGSEQAVDRCRTVAAGFIAGQGLVPDQEGPPHLHFPPVPRRADDGRRPDAIPATRGVSRRRSNQVPDRNGFQSGRVRVDRDSARRSGPNPARRDSPGTPSTCPKAHDPDSSEAAAGECARLL